MGDIPTLMGFIIRGFIWDIPILIFAYVLFWGPNIILCTDLESAQLAALAALNNKKKTADTACPGGHHIRAYKASNGIESKVGGELWTGSLRVGRERGCWQLRVAGLRSLVAIDALRQTVLETPPTHHATMWPWLCLLRWMLPIVSIVFPFFG